jgi:hypothetical protein
VSAKVYVAVQKIGSVIELPGFCRASPAWTACVDKPALKAVLSVFCFSVEAMKVDTLIDVFVHLLRIRKLMSHAIAGG